MTPKEIAQQIVNVQPISDEVYSAFYNLWKNSKSEKQLIEDGFMPMCSRTRLMWVKDELV